ncbi:MAG: arsenate reductase ArsC [Deltaproteobacteria bacterium]|nr:arsenate reductase ArsC [Deltaproteobacteria bacterium]
MSQGEWDRTLAEQPEKLKILYLCTGNACRSQMAEGWTRKLKGEIIEARSAGVDPQGVDPRAVRAMAEAGADISGQVSKHVDTLDEMEFDYVITLCGNAQKSCPVFPARTRVLHVGFDDPPKLAADAKTDEEAMAPYRRVRDAIRAFVERLPQALTGEREGR